MTITLELTPEQELRFASAEAQGVDVPRLMLNTLNNFPPASNGSEKTNLPKILKGRGTLANSPISVEAFERECREDAARGERELQEWPQK